MRSPEPAFLLDFASYTQRYADVGLPVYRPLEHQPVYPWSIAWRDEQLTEPVAAVVRGALALSRRKGWTSPPAGPGPVWLPPADPATNQPRPPPDDR